MGRADYARHITTCPHGFSGPPTALHTEGGAFAGCKTNLKPRNIFLHSFKRIWQAESKNSKWLGVISTNYTKKSRVWLRIYSSVYNTKTRMPCRPGGTYWDSWDFSQPNFAEEVIFLIPLLGGKNVRKCALWYFCPFFTILIVLKLLVLIKFKILPPGMVWLDCQANL